MIITNLYSNSYVVVLYIRRYIHVRNVVHIALHTIATYVVLIKWYGSTV